MPTPDRPVDGAEIATDWGQEIHDRVFAPKGCILAGDPVTVADNTLVQIPITDAIEDPGGWLSSPVAEVPTGGEGIYMGSMTFTTDDLDSGASLRCYVKVNGTEIARTDEPGDDAVQLSMSIVGLFTFAAGDQITTFTKKIGTAGPSVSVALSGITFVRIGAEVGA